MDGTAAELVFEDQGAHTSNRKSARSGQIEVLVRADRRRSWTPEQKFQIVSESLEQGAMATDVARRHGIGTGLLYTWRRQMVGLQRALSTQAGPRFASVALSSAILPADDHRSDPGPVSTSSPAGGSSPSRVDGLIEIVLPSGVSLRVDAHVDGRALRRVLGRSKTNDRAGVRAAGLFGLRDYRHA